MEDSDTAKPYAACALCVSEDVLVPGRRDVRATLDRPKSPTTSGIVACPPHPEHGGHRADGRLTAISDALTERGLACLRFDYGPWTGGSGEQSDAAQAIEWLQAQYESVGLFGYSFGAAIAITVAPNQPVSAVSVLAPPAQVGDVTDIAQSLATIRHPVQVVYGSRDTTVEWTPVVEQARKMDATVVEVAGDHFFVGQFQVIAEPIAEFFTQQLLKP